MPDVWIANASPLIALARAGQLDLLTALPGSLVVPEPVAEEILAGRDDPARTALASGWGTRRAVTVPERIAEWGLGRGESAVLALALELGAATAVLDDRAARGCGRALGIPVIGTFGVIILAKQRGILTAAEPVFRASRVSTCRRDTRSAMPCLRSAASVGTL